MKIWKPIFLFYLGGMAYCAMELGWRGRTHGSMFVTGGLCFVLIGRLNQVPSPLPLLPRALVGAGIITMLELGCGMLFNRSYTVWDYRNVPLNFRGQICLPFCLLWIPISLLAIRLYAGLDRLLTFPDDGVK
ncbi:MAG: hypothetical protein IJV82_04345 [Oscillospiraceae bacterium]|nr:hypothetical protein [Oscillospiraceae bacterium]